MTSGGILLGIAAFTALTVGPARADDAKTMTLAEAYQLALRNSEQVALAGAQVSQAEINQRATWNEITPSIYATGQGTIQRETKIENTVYGQNQFVGGATLSQPLFRKDFGDTRTAAGQRRESATASLSRQRETLAHDVAAAYIDVVRTRALQELDRVAVDRTVALRENTVGRVKAGGALHTAELLAQLDVQRAQRLYVNAQRDVGLAEAAFTRLVGRTPPAKLELPPLPAPPDQAKALETAKHRTDLKALELDIRAAEAETDAARGRRFWPKLDVQASVNYYAPDYLARTVDWRVVGLLTIPLLQSGTEYTDIALHENAQHIAALELDLQKKLVTDQVQAAAVVVTSSAQAYDLADQQLKTAREHYGLVEKQFKLGAVLFLEVSNAEGLLAEAENELAIAQADRVRAVYDYLFAIGALEVTAGSR